MDNIIRNKSVISSCLRIALILAAILFCFQSSGYAADITLKWDPNTEPDLAGYKIYYKSGFSGAPYDGVDIDQGSSPISLIIDDPDDPYYVDPDNPEFLLTGLDDNEDYFLVVTAYDNEEPYNESGFSNEVNTLDGSGGEVGSDGSSCFIATAGKPVRGTLIPVDGLDYMMLYINPFAFIACILFALTRFICGAKCFSKKTATST